MELLSATVYWKCEEIRVEEKVEKKEVSQCFPVARKNKLASSSFWSLCSLLSLTKCRHLSGLDLVHLRLHVFQSDQQDFKNPLNFSFSKTPVSLMV